MIYIAKRACFYGNTLFKAGEKINYDRDVVPCAFCGGKKVLNGKPCLKCRGTGRQEPSHHFRPESEAVSEATINEAAVVASEVDSIRSEIKSLGGDYDNRWGLTRLKQALITIRKDKGK